MEIKALSLKCNDTGQPVEDNIMQLCRNVPTGNTIYLYLCKSKHKCHNQKKRMDMTEILAISGICLGVAGAIYGWSRNRASARMASSLTQAREEAGKLHTENAVLRERLNASMRDRGAEKQAEEERFRNLANEIFRTHTDRFKQSSEQRLDEILGPLKADIEGFRAAVNNAYSTEAKERFSLRAELRRLTELNSSLGEEAKELTRALKGDSKVQGDWGEMILERLLEMSGLKKGVHFETQATTNNDGSRLKNDNGRQLRPDVVVHYPDERCVVIDSKVSLNAYTDYINAPAGSGTAEEAGRRHVLSVRRHVAELADKRYQDIVGDKRLDFVIMFIPNEGAYFAMMRLAPEIWEEAYAKRVLISSPTHLIAILRMLEQLWKQDAINRNVQEIARLSGTMLDKFANFTSDLDNIARHLSAADSAYQQARRRLAEGPGNLCTTARKIMDLGAKTGKGSDIRRLSQESD